VEYHKSDPHSGGHINHDEILRNLSKKEL